MVAMLRTGECGPHTCELLLTIVWVEDVWKPVQAILRLRTVMVAEARLKGKGLLTSS
jgi:hypothetical protein